MLCLAAPADQGDTSSRDSSVKGKANVGPSGHVRSVHVLFSSSREDAALVIAEDDGSTALMSSASRRERIELRVPAARAWWSRRIGASRWTIRGVRPG